MSDYDIAEVEVLGQAAIETQGIPSGVEEPDLEMPLGLTED